MNEEMAGSFTSRNRGRVEDEILQTDGKGEFTSVSGSRILAGKENLVSGEVRSSFDDGRLIITWSVSLPTRRLAQQSTYVGSVTHEDRVCVHPNGRADLVRPWRDVDDLEIALGAIRMREQYLFVVCRIISLRIMSTYPRL